MKKKLCSICLILAILCLCGCGRKPEPVPTTEAAPNTVTVTFSEGMTVSGIAERLEKNGVCAAADFIEASQTAACDFTVPDETSRPFRLEGYVFPDTYEFYLGESATSVLSRFLSNTAVKFTDADAARADALGYSMDEILTIASIIQKEAGDEAQMPKVSAVLHNRLQKDMMLQCDVTYFYLSKTVMPYYCGDTWDDALYEAYADNYYTYRFRGLPKGPICNPGTAAIHAALYPADTAYLYFVSDSSGNYYYSDTFEEHRKTCKTIGVQ